MSTSAVYTLLEMKERDSSTSGNDDPDEGLFEVGGRTSWDFTLDIAFLESGVSVQVVVEASPTGGDDTWTEIHDFALLSSTGDTTATGVSVATGLEFIKARVKSISGGSAWLEVTATSPFLDPADANLDNWVSKEVRNFSDGKTRLIERAEQDVLDRQIGRSRLGKPAADLTRPDSLDRMKRAVAAQAEHQLRRELLQRSGEASDQVTLRQMGEMSDELDEILDPILDDEGLMVWEGR